MSGALWATLAGVGFGLFQSLNRQAIRGMDVWQSTFVQLSVSSVILLAGAVATEDLSAAWSASPAALAAFLAAGLEQTPSPKKYRSDHPYRLDEKERCPQRTVRATKQN